MEKLRNKAKEELERLDMIANNNIIRSVVYKFLSKFIICEIVYKVLLSNYLVEKKKSKTRMKIQIQQVKAVIIYSGYQYDEVNIPKLFSSNTAEGQRTAKSIRDILMHSMSKSAIEELIDREEELTGYMDSFLKIIRSHEN